MPPSPPRGRFESKRRRDWDANVARELGTLGGPLGRTSKRRFDAEARSRGVIPKFQPSSRTSPLVTTVGADRRCRAYFHEEGAAPPYTIAMPGNSRYQRDLQPTMASIDEAPLPCEMESSVRTLWKDLRTWYDETSAFAFETVARLAPHGDPFKAVFVSGQSAPLLSASIYEDGKNDFEIYHSETDFMMFLNGRTPEILGMTIRADASRGRGWSFRIDAQGNLVTYVDHIDVRDHRSPLEVPLEKERQTREFLQSFLSRVWSGFWEITNLRTGERHRGPQMTFGFGTYARLRN